jgi:hypothetical protein
MSTLLITVALGDRRRDLAVRSDVPIADLLVPLAEALAATVRRSAGTDARTDAGIDAGIDAGTDAGTPQALGLAPLCGEALPAGRSLEECGIGHGAVLVLIGGSEAPRSPDSAYPDPARPDGGRSRRKSAGQGH